MAKVNDERLEKYRLLDKKAFDFSNKAITGFFERATPQGYNLDTTGFLAHPGFFQAPHRQDLDNVDIAMVGSPLDLGAIGLAGARHGPKAIRECSRNYGPVNDTTGHIPFEQTSIIDYGDVQWSATDLTVRLEDIAGVFQQLGEADLYTLNCGGEHTTSFGALKGLSTAHDDSFGLIHIDAHCDTMATWGGDTVNDGSLFRHAVINGYIDPERTVQIGIRGRSIFLWEFSHDSGMTVITADEVFDKGTAYVIDKAREVVGKDKAYISLDVDGLDSSVMMGTTGPEPFGLMPRQVRDIIHGARGLNIIGADMVELNPNRDPAEISAHTAAALFFELLCLLADCRVEQTGKSKPTNW
ncbi:MAG: agmatinase [Gammaproteobacteria bacterium]|nr:agmatinase [Gammaproteobacteria bacterium]